MVDGGAFVRWELILIVETVVRDDATDSPLNALDMGGLATHGRSRSSASSLEEAVGDSDRGEAVTWKILSVMSSNMQFFDIKTNTVP